MEKEIIDVQTQKLRDDDEKKRSEHARIMAALRQGESANSKVHSGNTGKVRSYDAAKKNQ